MDKNLQTFYAYDEYLSPAPVKIGDIYYRISQIRSPGCFAEKEDGEGYLLSIPRYEVVKLFVSKITFFGSAEKGAALEFSLAEEVKDYYGRKVKLFESTDSISFIQAWESSPEREKIDKESYTDMIFTDPYPAEILVKTANEENRCEWDILRKKFFSQIPTWNELWNWFEEHPQWVVMPNDYCLKEYK